MARPRRAPRGSAVYGVLTGGARGEPGYKQQAQVVREYRNGIQRVVILTGSLDHWLTSSLAEGSPADGTKIRRRCSCSMRHNPQAKNRLELLKSFVDHSTRSACTRSSPPGEGGSWRGVRFTCLCVPGACFSRRSGRGSDPVAPEPFEAFEKLRRSVRTRSSPPGEGGSWRGARFTCLCVPGAGLSHRKASSATGAPTCSACTRSSPGSWRGVRFTCPCVPGAGLSRRRSGLGSAPVAPERLTQHLLRLVQALGS